MDLLQWKQVPSPDFNRSDLMQPLQKLFPQQGVTVALTISSLQMGQRRSSKRSFAFAHFGTVLFLLSLQGLSWEGEGFTLNFEPILGRRCFIFFLSLTLLRTREMNRGGDTSEDLEARERSKGLASLARI